MENWNVYRYERKKLSKKMNTVVFVSDRERERERERKRERKNGRWHETTKET